VTINKFLAASAIAALLASSAGAASAASIVNGGFEAGTGDTPPYATLSGGSTSITGWTVTGGSVDWINGYWNASEGTHSLDLNGLDVGGITQTIATVAGQTYNLSFDLSANPDLSGPRSILVSAGNASQTFTFAGPSSLGAMNWQSNLFQFVATGSTTALSFDSASVDNCCWGPALDNVAITGVAVPEPATWTMAILGFGMLGAAVRRRKLAMATAA
jgi:choice-of-anchor C domain-containing protein